MKVQLMAPCSLCHKESMLYFRSRDYNRRISSENFNHYRCPMCDLIFIAPIPDNLGDYYPVSYYGEPPSHDQLAAKAILEHFKIDIVQKFVSTGKLLEIGPAYSAFPWLAKQAGFEVDIIEMNPSCCQFWNDVIGLRAINNSDICLALKDLVAYNVVTLWHVIEHLANPWRTLEAISEQLLPGGILIIATPNPDAFQFHALKQYWPHVDAPRHLMLIPAPLIIDKMKSLGFKTTMHTTNDTGGLSWNRFGWVYFLSNMSNWRIMKLASRLLGWMVSILVIPLERKEGKGCAYTLVFTKETAK